LSTRLFGGDIETGRQAFQDANVAKLEHVISLARILQPHQVRLLMASSSKRSEILHSGVYLAESHPWVVEVYQDAVDRLTAAGQRSVIENEVGGCLFATPAEIVSFFTALGRSERARLIWDVQNLWQLGTFPTLEVYHALKPYIGMIHLKGGRAEVPGGKLKWRAYLEDASWPVVPIVRQVIADGVSPVICLNPSHGESSPDYGSDPGTEIEFLRRTFKEIA
jgi:sugar phosphate isomerase/epimerase